MTITSSPNLLGLWIPLGVALALALGTTRLRSLGTATTIATCGLGLALTIWIAATPAAQRPDYRELADRLGPAAQARLIVSQTSFSSPLVLYLDDTVPIEGDPLTTSELVVITPREIEDYGVGTCWWIHTCGGRDLAPPPRFEVLAGFELRKRGSTELFDYAVYEAPASAQIARPVEYFTPRIFLQTPP